MGGSVGGVDAGVGADEPVAGDADQHAARRAQHLAATRRARPARGGGPCRCSPASSRASGPGVTSASARTRPSALETILWAITTTSPRTDAPARRRCAAARSAPRCRRRAAPRAIPRAPPRRLRSSDELRLQLVEHPARVGGAAVGRRRACRGPGRGPRGCRRRAPASGTSTTSGTRARRPCALSTWRWRLPGAEAGSNASGGVSSSALVPVPWRSGTISTERSPTGRSISSSSCLGSSSGQSPGTSSTRSAPHSSARRDPVARPRRCGPGRESSMTVAP